MHSCFPPSPRHSGQKQNRQRLKWFIEMLLFTALPLFYLLIILTCSSFLKPESPESRRRSAGVKHIERRVDWTELTVASSAAGWQGTAGWKVVSMQLCECVKSFLSSGWAGLHSGHPLHSFYTCSKCEMAVTQRFVELRGLSLTQQVEREARTKRRRRWTWTGHRRCRVGKVSD